MLPNFDRKDIPGPELFRAVVAWMLRLMTWTLAGAVLVSIIGHLLGKW